MALYTLSHTGSFVTLHGHASLDLESMQHHTAMHQHGQARYVSAMNCRITVLPEIYRPIGGFVPDSTCAYLSSTTPPDL